jgi:hypothetical protein
MPVTMRWVCLAIKRKKSSSVHQQKSGPEAAIDVSKFLW